MWVFDHLHEVLAGTPLAVMAEPWARLSNALMLDHPHGDRAHWEVAIRGLPSISISSVGWDRAAVSAQSLSAPGVRAMAQLQGSLQALHPWRKGPFNLFGLEIDAEWQSHLKWSRIVPHVSSLKGKMVLDVGCGNGYYLYRMLGAGAEVAVGIDPTQLFLAQFRALDQYLGAARAVVLPLCSADLANVGWKSGLLGFDTVFSMGVYYHCRDPARHLRELAGFLRPGGELVLETLILREEDDTTLVPQGRYARMRNVWSVPTIRRVATQLVDAGFTSVQTVNVAPTTVTEQRSTDWMTFESLAECLDPADPSRTVEGYPAPVRACLIATR